MATQDQASVRAASAVSGNSAPPRISGQPLAAEPPDPVPPDDNAGLDLGAPAREIDASIVDPSASMRAQVMEVSADNTTLRGRIDELERNEHDGAVAQRDMRAQVRKVNAANTALRTRIDELERNEQDRAESQPIVRDAGIFGALWTIAKVIARRTRELASALERTERRTFTTSLASSERRTVCLRQELAAAQRDAACDHLTGLPNRRAFELVLAKAYAAAMEFNRPLCIAFVDVDHFKQVNDTHGHDAGDDVLRVIATTLASISSDHCHVARHGGEEFVVLFSEHSLDAACAVLDRARAAMAERDLVSGASDLPIGRVTFSGGIADVMAADTPRDALRAADMALMRAKSEGRNRICGEHGAG